MTQNKHFNIILNSTFFRVRVHLHRQFFCGDFPILADVIKCIYSQHNVAHENHTHTEVTICFHAIAAGHNHTNITNVNLP